MSGPGLTHVAQPARAISDVEFVSCSEADVVGRVDEACIIIRCIVANLNSAIKAYARQMETEQLDSAR